MLESYVKEIVPVEVEVALTNKPDWDGSSAAFVAEYSVKVPRWVSGAGRRALLPVGLFSATEKHMYEHSTRVHPLYFRYKLQMDDVRIELPLGWQVRSVPQPVTQDVKFIIYKSRAENKNGAPGAESRNGFDFGRTEVLSDCSQLLPSGEKCR